MTTTHSTTRTAPAPGPLVPDTAADAVRRRALRRMRGLAVGLLLFAALVYVLTLDGTGFWGFVNAGAEASMVGAIADWFAVTALFRHPLGLPVPHTALIPRRKDQLARSLEEFFGENFLQESIVRERVGAAGISRRIGEWASRPEHARRVVDEVAEVASLAIARIDDDRVAELVEHALVPRFREEPIAPVLGSLLTEVVRDDLHHGVVDLGLEELHRWLVEHPDTVRDVLSERAPWWAPTRLNDAVTTRLHAEVVRWVDDIRQDPHHHAREAFDSMLGQLALDLLFDDDTRARAEGLKNRLLDHPQFTATGLSLWNALRQALLGALRDPEGELRRRLQAELVGFAERLTSDEELRQRLDDMAADAAVFVVERYGAELTTVITTTIERWDGREAAERIELHVGRDLQFIRINGTVVGGLVGVVIHAATVVL